MNKAMDIQDAYCLCVFVRDVKVIFPIVSQAFSVMKQKKKKQTLMPQLFLLWIVQQSCLQREVFCYSYIDCIKLLAILL